MPSVEFSELLEHLMIKLPPVVEAFAAEHIEAFREMTPSGKDCEYKLEYTAAHGKFKAVIEEEINSFVVAKGSEPQVFYERVKKVVDEGGPDSFLLELILAMSEFDKWYGLMYNEVQKKIAAGK